MFYHPKGLQKQYWRWSKNWTISPCLNSMRIINVTKCISASLKSQTYLPKAQGSVMFIHTYYLHEKPLCIYFEFQRYNYTAQSWSHRVGWLSGWIDWWVDGKINSGRWWYLTLWFYLFLRSYNKQHCWFQKCTLKLYKC